MRMAATTRGDFAAVDLGASSGRVITARVAPEVLTLREAHRFWNGPVELADGLHWDIVGLFHEVLLGLRAAGPVDGLAVDSWATDYGLLDASGALLGTPFHYRDPRSATGVERVQSSVGAAELYAVNGLQHLPFTSLYQLEIDPLAAMADTVLLIPDLIGFWLTGERVAELTNASTTGMLDVTSGQWSTRIQDALHLPPGLLPRLVSPGHLLAPLHERVCTTTGLARTTRVTTVGSHDTASAVLGVPAVDPDFAYVSCGTWALAGVELDAPLLTEAGRLANFTNEIGVDGTVRYLRNVMGLWVVQETVAAWQRQGHGVDLTSLLDEAAALPADGPTFDIDAPEFLPPGDMPARVIAACVQAGHASPTSPAAVVRSILDSLADALARTLEQAVQLSGRHVRVVHIVGGGARNALLCQLLADAVGLEVVAGPVEATAIGNVLVQARTHQVISGDRFALRSLVRNTHKLVNYPPASKPNRR